MKATAKQIAMIPVLILAVAFFVGLGAPDALGVDFMGHQINFIGAVYDPNTNATTFTYRVIAWDIPDTTIKLYYWELELDPACFRSGDIIDASEHYLYLGPDPVTGLYGIKFDQPYAPGETRIVWFRLRGDLSFTPVEIVVLTGCSHWRKEIPGPQCPGEPGEPSPECSVDPPSAAICELSSQQFCVVVSGGIPPYAYSWSNGATTQCITVSAAGTYSVTVTDDNDSVCTSEATLTLYPGPNCSVDPPSAEIFEDEGTSQEFCVVPSGGTPPYTYLWSNGATTDCITVSAAGTYSVTVTDANDCVGTCQATLTVRPPGGQGKSPGYWKHELAIYLGYAKKGTLKEPNVANYAAQYGYTAQQAYDIILVGEGGTLVQKLHRQLIAAKLSTAAGYLSNVDELLEQGQYMVAHPGEFTDQEIEDFKDLLESLHD